MNSRDLPGADLGFDVLPTDPEERHEALVDLFGRYVMWMRNRTLDSARDLVHSEEVRQHLGTIHRRPYEELAVLAELDRERALRFAETTVDAFIELLLRILAHRGTDFRLGVSHSVCYELNMEISDSESNEVLLEETINRGGEKHFADYWGRWLNRYGDEGRDPGASEEGGRYG